MRKLRTTLFLAVVCAAALVAGVWLAQHLRNKEARVSTPIGILAEPFIDLQGRPATVAEWHESVTLVNFWATWCAPCRDEIPVFMSLLERYRDRGFRVVGVAVDDIQAVERFGDELSINYPLLILEHDVNTVMQRYGDKMAILPYSVLVDAEGNTIARKLGAYEKTELDTLLARTLPPK